MNNEKWDKTNMPISCGRCGQIINKDTPYTLYFNPYSKISVCKECFDKEQNNESVTTWAVTNA